MLEFKRYIRISLLLVAFFLNVPSLLCFLKIFHGFTTHSFTLAQIFSFFPSHFKILKHINCGHCSKFSSWLHTLEILGLDFVHIWIYHRVPFHEGSSCLLSSTTSSHLPCACVQASCYHLFTLCIMEQMTMSNLKSQNLHANN